MKKGFTLVELLGVLIVLSVIALITIPPINKYIADSKQDLYDNQIDSIKLSAQNWGSDNRLLLPESEGESIFITLCQLKKGGYVDENIKNPITGDLFYSDMAIIITKENNNYAYEVFDKSGSTDSCDLSGASIIVNGKNLEYVEIGSTYKEPAYKAFSNDGTDITNNVVKTIYRNGGLEPTVNANIMGQYDITYTVKSGSITTTLKRTVIVQDTTHPVITVLGKTESHKIVIEVGSTFQVPVATVTDNSMVTYNVTCGNGDTLSLNSNQCKSAVTSIDTSKVNEFKIEYSATDRENNKTSYILTVEIKDTIAPILEVSNNTNIPINTDYNLINSSLYKATDSGSGIKSVTATLNGNAITNTKDLTAGQYTINFTAIDFSGNTTTVPCTIIIVGN